MFERETVLDLIILGFLFVIVSALLVKVSLFWVESCLWLGVVSLCLGLGDVSLYFGLGYESLCFGLGCESKF